MDNLIKDIEVVDEIGKATDMAIDIMCLSQEIRKEFFSPRFKTEHEQQVFVWHVYERATSLFRILDNLIFDLSNILTILDKSLNEHLKATTQRKTTPKAKTTTVITYIRHKYIIKIPLMAAKMLSIPPHKAVFLICK